MNLSELKGALHEDNPLWTRRRALRDVESLPASDLKPALELLLTIAPEERSHFASDQVRAVASLTRAVLKAGQPVPHETFRFIANAQRAELVASLDDAAVIGITEAMVMAVPFNVWESWLEFFLPRYAELVGADRALSLCGAERPDVYRLLKAPEGVDLMTEVDRLLTEPAEAYEWGLAQLLLDQRGRWVKGGLAAIESRPLPTLLVVAPSFFYDSSAPGIQLAEIAAGKKPATTAESAQFGGLLFHAAGEALKRGEQERAKALFALTTKCDRPLTWAGRDVEDDEERALETSLSEDREKARRELLEEALSGEVSEEEARTLLGAEVKKSIYTETHPLVMDAAERWWVVARTGERSLGNEAQPEPEALEDVSALVLLNEYVAARAGRHIILVGRSSVHMHVVSSEAWELVAPLGGPLPPKFKFKATNDSFVSSLESTGDHLSLTVEEAGVPEAVRNSVPAVQRPLDAAGHHGLMEWLSSELRRGSLLEFEVLSDEAQRLSSWLRNLEPAQWRAIPSVLDGMGFPAGTVTVQSDPIDPAILESFDPALAEENLLSLWQKAGAMKISAGPREIRLFTPGAVADAQPAKLKDSEGSFKILAVDGKGNPMLATRIDDGSLRNDRYRYSIRKGAKWDHDWPLEKGLSTLLALEVRLASLIGREPFQDVRLGERVKLKEVKRAARRKTVKEGWAALEKWLKANEVDVRLKKGASAKALAAFEERFRDLPEDFLACWAKHNGDDETGLFAGWNMMDLNSIAQEFKFWTEEFDEDEPAPADDPKVASVWWDERWIPFCSSGGGDFLVLDASDSGKGQVFLALMDPPLRRVLAPSFTDFFLNFVHAVESGRISWAGEWSGREEFFDPGE